MKKNYLSKLSKEEELSLLTAAQNGDNSAATALLAQYEPLARTAAGRAIYIDSYDEALTEALFALYKAIMEYDKERDVPFAAWARAKVYGDLRTIANRVSREMKRREGPHHCLHGRWRRRYIRRLYRAYTRLAERLQIG